MSLAKPSSLSVNGAKLRIGIVAARFNESLVDTLLARVQAGLTAAGVPLKNVSVVRVPGSHEVPWAVQAMAAGRDCVIGLGVLIGGDTNHHEMVGQSVSHAFQQIALETGVPVINGVVVANTRAQAQARCAGRIDRGAEFAQAALEMGALKRSMGAKKS